MCPQISFYERRQTCYLHSVFRLYARRCTLDECQKSTYIMYSKRRKRVKGRFFVSALYSWNDLFNCWKWQRLAEWQQSIKEANSMSTRMSAAQTTHRQMRVHFNYTMSASINEAHTQEEDYTENWRSWNNNLIDDNDVESDNFRRHKFVVDSFHVRNTYIFAWSINICEAFKKFHRVSSSNAFVTKRFANWNIHVSSYNW